MILTSEFIVFSFSRKPRASGDDPNFAFPTGPSTSVNPARAGMIRTAPGPPRCTSSKPRASGDDPELGAQVPGVAG